MREFLKVYLYKKKFNKALEIPTIKINQPPARSYKNVIDFIEIINHNKALTIL